MPLQTAPHAGGHKDDRELTLMAAAVLCLVVGAWALGWVAAAVAGGAPRAGFTEFIHNIVRVFAPSVSATGKRPPKLPLTWWNLEGITRPMNVLVFWLVAIGLAAVVAGVVGVAIYNWRGGLPNIGVAGLGGKRRRAEPGGARWATARDLRSYFVSKVNPAGRMVMGLYQRRLVAVPKDSHMIVLGPTGKGKSTSFAIPAGLEHLGPTVIFSVKGDVVEATVGRRQQLGSVQFYDPTNSMPFYSTRANFNPIEGCKDVMLCLRRGKWIGVGTGSDKPAGDGEFQWWTNARDSLLAAYLCAAAWADADMQVLRNWVNNDDFWTPIEIIGGDEGRNEFAKWYAAQFEEADPERFMIPVGSSPSRIEDPTQRRAAWEILMRALRTNPKQFESMSSMARQAMEIWLNPNVLDSASAGRPNFDVRQFLSGPNTLYVVAPGEAQEQVAPLNVSVVMEIWRTLNIMATNGETLPDPPLLFIFDEMANICPLPDFDKLISTCRGLGIRIMSLWQDFSQIEKRYGQDVAGTIFNNHQVRVALDGIADDKTAEYFTKFAGSRHVSQVSTTRAAGGQSQSYSQGTEQMLDVGAFRMLGEGQVLCLVGSEHPFFVDQRRYWADPRLKAMAEYPYFPGVEHLRGTHAASPKGGTSAATRNPIARVRAAVRR